MQNRAIFGQAFQASSKLCLRAFRARGWPLFEPGAVKRKTSICVCVFTMEGAGLGLQMNAGSVTAMTDWHLATFGAFQAIFEYAELRTVEPLLWAFCRPDRSQASLAKAWKLPTPRVLRPCSPISARGRTVPCARCAVQFYVPRRQR